MREESFEPKRHGRNHTNWGGEVAHMAVLSIIGIHNDPSGFLPPPLVIVIVPFKATIESHCLKYSAWGSCASSNDTLETLRCKIATCNWLYCTPEKITRNEHFKSMISGQAHRIRYVVYDEAHESLADWRPELLKLPAVVASILPNVIKFACTATCSTTDMPRLLQRLKIQGIPCEHRCSVDRSNCFLRVVPAIAK